MPDAWRPGCRGLRARVAGRRGPAWRVAHFVPLARRRQAAAGREPDGGAADAAGGLEPAGRRGTGAAAVGPGGVGTGVGLRPRPASVDPAGADPAGAARVPLPLALASRG